MLNTTLLDGKKNIQLQFKSSPVGTWSHGYDANNSFLLNVFGERMLIRSGRRDMYASNFHSNWMWETKSENNITVNGIGQKNTPVTQKEKSSVSSPEKPSTTSRERPPAPTRDGSEVSVAGFSSSSRR
ncbi:MAG: heparinase II/III family protein [Lentisphaeria bacterium]|nr:MAG: heparinase II/III family protein [Lentisphaeria bacterium]